MTDIPVVTMDKRKRVFVICEQIIPGIYESYLNKKLDLNYCISSLDRNTFRAFELEAKADNKDGLDELISTTYHKYMRLYGLAR